MQYTAPGSGFSQPEQPFSCSSWLLRAPVVYCCLLLGNSGIVRAVGRITLQGCVYMNGAIHLPVGGHLMILEGRVAEQSCQMYSGICGYVSLFLLSR